jgi:hypothetical protein
MSLNIFTDNESNINISKTPRHLNLKTQKRIALTPARNSNLKGLNNPTNSSTPSKSLLKQSLLQKEPLKPSLLSKPIEKDENDNQIYNLPIQKVSKTYKDYELNLQKDTNCHNLSIPNQNESSNSLNLMNLTNDPDFDLLEEIEEDKITLGKNFENLNLKFVTENYEKLTDDDFPNIEISENRKSREIFDFPEVETLILPVENQDDSFMELIDFDFDSVLALF